MYMYLMILENVSAYSMEAVLCSWSGDPAEEVEEEEEEEVGLR